MHITLAAIGSRGDLQPYIALGLRLEALGHAVLVATHAPYEPLVRAYGLSFKSISGDPNKVLRGDDRSGLQHSANPVIYIRSLREIARSLISDMTRDCLAACQSADLVLTNVLGIFPISSVLEKLGIPGVMACMQPATATTEFQHYQLPPFPRRMTGRGLYNRLSYSGVQQLVWRMLGAPVNAARYEVLGLPPASIATTLKRKAEMLHLYAYSKHLVPQPADWPKNHHVTGSWFLDPPTAWQAPPEVTRFLAAGPPPVYIGFGSMRATEPEVELEQLITALDRADQRGVIMTGETVLRRQVPNHVLLVEDIPHAWLFPQLAAVVHHGGSGTTAAGLRAGRPTVTVPFIADQHFWGRSVYGLGLGPAPIPHKELSAGNLAAAIRQAVSDTTMQSRAATVGTHMQDEDGVGNTIEYLSSYLKV